MTRTIHTILDEFRQNKTSDRELGDKFERLVKVYFKNDELQKQVFKNVWLWNEWPGNNGRVDTGIDLVAEDYDGEFTAIQCKCFDPKSTLDKSHIDSFFTESGKAPFSDRIIFATTDKWSTHAEKSLHGQKTPVRRLGVQDLENSTIDWATFNLKTLDKVRKVAKKTIRPHQLLALNNVMAGFNVHDRGQQIMACGTGKTFTSLKIAEEFTKNDGKANILFLVPSLSLMSQSLREWSSEADVSLQSIAVCSDTKVGKSKKNDDNEDISVSDLPFPATTDAQKIVDYLKNFQGKKQLTVVFCTYQSIQTIAEAQNKGLPVFDLIICDEAHRTTGASLSDKDKSNFTLVHDENLIKGKKRLYMTATPRIYNPDAKEKAQEKEIIFWSMDDEDTYGPEFHRLGFGEAVGNDLLSDYKVIVLAVDERYVSAEYQALLSNDDNELTLEDVAKIIGCWNGLSKRMATDADGEEIKGDTAPMRRAIAFTSSIKDSQAITNLFSKVVNEYKSKYPDESVLDIEIDHVDGTQNALERVEKLDWLKENSDPNTCRILSNARCLSEGVDVPALDAVIFLSPRNSIVDVIQSVGRAMRKAPGKKYGYIILPVAVPAGMQPEEALNDNKKYSVVWNVLQALRSHDDRYDAMINKIDVNQNRPARLEIVGIGKPVDENNNVIVSEDSSPVQLNINFPHLEEWRDAIYAKIVVKCGNRRYWEDWAKDVADIANRQTTRIETLVNSSGGKHREEFNDFVESLQDIINPSITEADAIEMLSQHLITKPVFDALFENYQFTKFNPVSVAMQKMLDTLEGESLEKETKKLDDFYTSVKMRAGKIDNAEGKQKIIIELYDKFFKNAFPKMAERLGIVYTPVEVVDFIVKSVDFALKQEFGQGLTDEGVHILDPFTGTGTFMVRLLQNGLIEPNDLQRKFTKELHANEIVLLAYYIAAINIEATYHDLAGGKYQPFNGIVLTDTFNQMESQGSLNQLMFPENNQRVKNQKKNDIRVIIGNPPYSAGQKSENDGNKNLKYENLDQQIRNTYAKYSTATNKNSLYDSYIRAIRWATDRLKDKGIICFVTNGSFLDSNSADGLRKCLADDFTSIYYFNLRGNGRTSGERCRQEGHPLFAALGGKGGSLAPIAIILLIKNPKKQRACQLFYHDIGNYLTRQQKLSTIQEFGDISAIDWEKITPNESYDWINQRNDIFESFISLGDKKDKTSKTIFDVYSNGVKTNRDNWVYNFSQESVIANMTRMIDFYNSQVEDFRKYLKGQNLTEQRKKVESFINNDPKKISWTGELKEDCAKLIIHTFNPNEVRKSMYRPFYKQLSYFNKDFNERTYQMPKIFPNQELENLVICVSGIGVTKDFNAFIVNTIPDVQLQANGQCFSLYSYETQENIGSLFAGNNRDKYVRRENIPDDILSDFRKTYKDKKLTKEDIFYYVYGILHSPEYKQRFSSDLKKMLPRIPYAKDFWVFSKAGRDLAHWHLNYETIDPYELTEVSESLVLDAKEYYQVQKMMFGKTGKVLDKTKIIYNSKVTLTDIPLEAYEYIVNGKSALDWIMERYQVTTDKDSGIVNNPNDWSDDPRYIIDLVKRIVRVSLETMKIVNSLPALNELNK